MIRQASAAALLLAALVAAAPGCKPSAVGRRAEGVEPRRAQPAPRGDSAAAASAAEQARSTAPWQTDAGAWLPVETLAGCSTRVAREPAAIWPGLAFEACGPGCREARVMPGARASVAAVLGTAARVVDGTLEISLSTRTVEGKSSYLLGTYAFGDGKPSVLIEESGACVAQVAGRGSLSSFRLFAREGDGTHRVGWFDRATSRTHWLSRRQEALVAAYDFEGGWGGIEAFKTLLGAGEPTTAELAPLYASAGSISYPSSNAGLVVFAEWLQSSGRVMGWRPGQGATPLASGPWHVARVGLSADRVAWLGAMGERAGEGLYTSARLYVCKRSAHGEPCQVDAGPTLPITSSGGVLAIQGRFVALNGCVAEGCSVYVADLGNARLFRVRPSHPGHGAEVIGLSDSELFLADYSEALRGTPDFDRLVRYDLAELEAFATRL